MFRDYYSKVKLRVDSILSISGEQHRIVTAGGVTSWQDLALYLIARLCGHKHAIRTAKIHLLSDHTDGQLPFAAITRRVQRTDAVIGDCQGWIAENYACRNPVAQMVARSSLKPRTFARRFLAATGYHPMDYVHALRIEEAKQLLEADTVAVEEVGHVVGYEDPTFFRRLFKREAGLRRPPTEGDSPRSCRPHLVEPRPHTTVTGFYMIRRTRPSIRFRLRTEDFEKEGRPALRDSRRCGDS